MKIFFGIFLSISSFLMLLPSGSQAGTVDLVAKVQKKGYFVAKKYSLHSTYSGLKGTLELLQDKTFKTWKNPGSRDEGQSDGGDSLDTTKFKPALLRLLARDGSVVETVNLKSVWYEPVWITLGQEDLYGSGRISFFVELDGRTGFGPMQGTCRRYFDIKNGQIVWLKAKEHKSGKTHTIDLDSNMLAVWQTAVSPKGKGKVILERWCKYPENVTYYDRYEFNGQEWIEYRQVEKGAKDAEVNFPNIRAFY